MMRNGGGAGGGGGGLTLPREIFQSGPAWLPSSLPSAAGVNLVN